MVSTGPSLAPPDPELVVRRHRVVGREDQVALEQPGCLHATMDLYKWAYKLGPAVPGVE